MLCSEDTNFKPVPTRASLILQAKNKSIDFKTLVFKDKKTSLNDDDNDSRQKTLQKSSESPDKSQKNIKTELSETKGVKKTTLIDGPEFDIKKVRHEILNFSIKNQHYSKNKKKMEIFQAVKLGAKPPKKEYKNYKDFLEERKRLKKIREERKKFHQIGKNQTGAASVKCRSKTKLEKLNKKRAPVSSIDQHYGKTKTKLAKN